jgi:hypothetical protein
VDAATLGKLLCFPDLVPNLEKHNKDANYKMYRDKNFNYILASGFVRELFQGGEHSGE